MTDTHSLVQIKYPNIEILFCRRDIIEGWDLQNLRMPYWRIYCPYNKCGGMYYDGRTILMRPGNVYLISPETDFSSFTRSGKLEKLYVHFTVGGEYKNCCNHIFDFPIDKTIKILTDKMSDKLLAFRNDSELSMCALALCSNLLARLIPDRFIHPQHTDEKMLKIWNLLRDNPQGKYSNESLASRVNLSASAFIRKFTIAFGIAPQQFLMGERLRMASSLLVNSNLSIEEIAEKTCFCDRFYFTKMFTKYRKVSPAAFRRKTFRF